MIRIFLLICTFNILTIYGDSNLAHNVGCTTTKGYIEFEIYPDWAPIGSNRFLELVRDGFFEDIALYRCVKRFLTQFGISDKPRYRHWHRENIKDDNNLGMGIKKYYLSFAGGGPNTRSTQLFIAFEDLDFLGKEPWETPFGVVVKGQDVVDSFYTGYGDIEPFSKTGPNQQKIYNIGNDYLKESFPKLDYILSCDIVPNSTSTLETIDFDHNKKPEGLHEEILEMKTPNSEKTSEEALNFKLDKFPSNIGDISRLERTPPSSQPSYLVLKMHHIPFPDSLSDFDNSENTSSQENKAKDYNPFIKQKNLRAPGGFFTSSSITDLVDGRMIELPEVLISSYSISFIVKIMFGVTFISLLLLYILRRRHKIDVLVKSR
jgi:cyclophilin family peptidyl-prolyl cis-trans isomerase